MNKNFISYYQHDGTQNNKKWKEKKRKAKRRNKKKLNKLHVQNESGMVLVHNDVSLFLRPFWYKVENRDTQKKNTVKTDQKTGIHF